jgi:hypothetical protein
MVRTFRSRGLYVSLVVTAVQSLEIRTYVDRVVTEYR